MPFAFVAIAISLDSIAAVLAAADALIMVIVEPPSVAKFPLASDVTSSIGPDWRDNDRADVIPGAVIVSADVPRTIWLFIVVVA